MADIRLTFHRYIAIGSVLIVLAMTMLDGTISVIDIINQRFSLFAYAKINDFGKKYLKIGKS